MSKLKLQQDAMWVIFPIGFFYWTVKIAWNSVSANQFPVCSCSSCLTGVCYCSWLISRCCSYLALQLFFFCPSFPVLLFMWFYNTKADFRSVLVWLQNLTMIIHVWWKCLFNRLMWKKNVPKVRLGYVYNTKILRKIISNWSFNKFHCLPFHTLFFCEYVHKKKLKKEKKRDKKKIGSSLEFWKRSNFRSLFLRQFFFLQRDFFPSC